MNEEEKFPVKRGSFMCDEWKKGAETFKKQIRWKRVKLAEFFV